MTIKELKEAIENFNDNDLVVVEIHEGVRYEDLYDFSIDEMTGVCMQDGNIVSEIRICI